MPLDKKENKYSNKFGSINSVVSVPLCHRNNEYCRLSDYLLHLSPGPLYLAVAHLGILQEIPLSGQAISEAIRITMRDVLEIMSYLISGRTHVKNERVSTTLEHKKKGFRIIINTTVSLALTHEVSTEKRALATIALATTDAVSEYRLGKVLSQRLSLVTGELAYQPLRRWFLRCRKCDEDISRHVTLVDACSYGRIGLNSAFRHSLFADEVIAISSLSAAFFSTPCKTISGTVERYLVVRMPLLPRESLVLLLQLCELMQISAPHYHQIVVLSSFDVERVKSIITVMGGRSILVADARLSMPSLCSTVLSLVARKVPTLVNGTESPLLTPYEHKALYQCLKDIPVYLQAHSRHVSPKTIYTQRSDALRKFGVTNILSLLRSLSEGRNKL